MLSSCNWAVMLTRLLLITSSAVFGPDKAFVNRYQVLMSKDMVKGQQMDSWIRTAWSGKNHIVDGEQGWERILWICGDGNSSGRWGGCIGAWSSLRLLTACETVVLAKKAQRQDVGSHGSAEAQNGSSV